MDAIVLGCGVVGLSSAIRLAEAGHKTRIWAKALPPDTTSNVAAAIWYPYKASPEEKVRTWGAITLKELVRLSDVKGSGVKVRPGKKVFHRPMGDPWWRDLVPHFRRLTKEELGPHQGGYAFSVPIADMSIYLTHYLIDRFEGLGGAIEKREVKSVEEALQAAPLVVNCTGLGAREILRDEELFPIRGQVVRVKRLRSESFLLDSDNPLGMIYVIPRSEDAILGGVAEEGEWGLEPDPKTAAAILERCRQAIPELKDAEIVSHPVGLRPGRSAIRLEVEKRPHGIVVHNYGHGGSGVTLSWGCADEVVDSIRGLV